MAAFDRPGGGVVPDLTGSFNQLLQTFGTGPERARRAEEERLARLKSVDIEDALGLATSGDPISPTFLILVFSRLSEKNDNPVDKPLKTLVAPADSASAPLRIPAASDCPTPLWILATFAADPAPNWPRLRGSL